MKSKFIDFYMETAFNAADLSYCERMKVGCVIVKDGKIISYGYNGTFPGEDNCCEDSDNNTKDDVIHAEENALMKLARTNDSAEGASIFITHQPCINCSRLIANSGITDVYYAEEYRCNKGINLLNSRNINVVKV